MDAMPVNPLPFEYASPVREGSLVYKVREGDKITSAQLFPVSIPFSQSKPLQDEYNKLLDLVANYRACIPKPISWGFTADGFVYLQSEWIDGTSLDGLAAQLGTPMFPLRTVLQVGEELSRILTLSHKAGLPHGNLHAAQVVLEHQSEQYWLTGFSIVPLDGQQAVLAQKDLRDLAHLLVTMLTGLSTVLTEDWYAQRAALIPSQWPEEERNIPTWLVQGINNILFPFVSPTGVHSGDLYNQFLRNRAKAAVPYQRKAQRSEPQPPAGSEIGKKSYSIIKPSILIAVALVTLISSYVLYTKDREGARVESTSEVLPVVTDTQVNGPIMIEEPKKPLAKKKKKKQPLRKPVDPVMASDSLGAEPQRLNAESDNAAQAPATSYKVRSKAYFHNSPDPSTKRKAFIVHWNKAVLKPTREENDFVYIVFTNHEGQTSRGWIKKADLLPVE